MELVATLSPLFLIGWPRPRVTIGPLEPMFSFDIRHTPEAMNNIKDLNSIGNIQSPC